MTPPAVGRVTSQPARTATNSVGATLSSGAASGQSLKTVARSGLDAGRTCGVGSDRPDHHVLPLGTSGRGTEHARTDSADGCCTCDFQQSSAIRAFLAGHDIGGGTGVVRQERGKPLDLRF